MSDQAATIESAPRALPDASGRHPAAQSRWTARILPLVAFLAVVIAIAWEFRNQLLDGNSYTPIIFGVILAIVLSLLPCMICVVQSTTRRRHWSRLTRLRNFPAGHTQYFRTAITSVEAQNSGTLDADFQMPLFCFFLVVFLGFIAFLIGYPLTTFFKIPSVILGGMIATGDPDLPAYQEGTYCVLATAFIASYVYSLGRLLDRVNNADLYPISLYVYSVQVVSAVIVAGVFRHTANAFGITQTTILLLVAFAIGFSPNLVIIALLGKAFQIMKIWANRGNPKTPRPPALPLLMIDDLSRDKIDRLGELGIDSAQVLAQQNPFLLLPRLPYDLVLLVDWIGQAQLYSLVKDEMLLALRRMYIRDASDLYLHLATDASRATVARLLQIDDADAIVLRQQLEQNPSFVRLREVRMALVPPTQPADAIR